MTDDYSPIQIPRGIRVTFIKSQFGIETQFLDENGVIVRTVKSPELIEHEARREAATRDYERRKIEALNNCSCHHVACECPCHEFDEGW